MIYGRVRFGREAMVPIAIHGRRQSRIEAVLDTGFTGHLCLAARLQRRMLLRRRGDVEMDLADGHRVKQPAYVGEVSFAGGRQTVLVTLTRLADSLLGTSLLAGKRVSVDFVRCGSVVISDA